jgi:Protein of unknown function (DUF2716)
MDAEQAVWTELERDAGRQLWAEFAERYHFRAGTSPKAWPGIREPTPSITWDLSAIFRGPQFDEDSRAVAQLVLDVLTVCTEWWESVVFHDWVHPSAQFWPHRVDTLDDVPSWDAGGLFPNGDYTIFLARGDRFGVFGHPWEQTLCVFGADALAALRQHNHGALTHILRQDGQPSAERGSNPAG